MCASLPHGRAVIRPAGGRWNDQDRAARVFDDDACHRPQPDLVQDRRCATTDDQQLDTVGEIDQTPVRASTSVTHVDLDVREVTTDAGEHLLDRVSAFAALDVTRLAV